MALFRNKSAAPQTVAGAGLADPGGLLDVPENLARGLSGPDWELLPAEASAETTAAEPFIFAGSGEHVEDQP
ncbi:MAG: hypothetical protein HY910_07370 [Desulfarculus sp.]|nr:hypothetical protein [Desulfarculus sp.]